MCIGSQVFTDQNVPSGLLGWWTFDDSVGHDSSGNLNPLTSLAPAGPAVCNINSGGQGASLSFDGETAATIPHSTFYESNEFSVAFWLFLTQDSTGDWRTIFHKGDSPQELTPSILLWPKERRLHVRTSTQFNWNEGLDSLAVLRLRRWVHITVVGSGQLLQLYTNGIVDSQTILKGPIKFNRGDIYIGKDPWHSGIQGFVDDLRIFGKPLHDRDLLSLAAPAVPLAYNSGVMLSCQLCTYDDALASCMDNYHLCSLEELYAGPFELARALGWFRFTADIWTRNTEESMTTTSDEMQDPDLFKLGMCCRDY